MISTLDNEFGDKKDPELEKIRKKASEVSSRYSSLSWAAEDYDRQKGKGAFKKKFKTESKLMDNLLEEKTKLKIAEAVYTPTKEEEVAKGHDVPILPGAGLDTP